MTTHMFRSVRRNGGSEKLFDRAPRHVDSNERSAYTLPSLLGFPPDQKQVTYKQCTLPYQRTALNVLRRYKWAFKPEYDDLAPAPPFPDLRLFAPDVEGTIRVSPLNAA